MKSKERPYVLFVAEAIYNEVSKIKKKNPNFSNIDAIENFIGTKTFNEISSGEFHNKWLNKLKKNNLISPYNINDLSILKKNTLFSFFITLTVLVLFILNTQNIISLKDTIFLPSFLNFMETLILFGFYSFWVTRCYYLINKNMIKIDIYKYFLEDKISYFLFIIFLLIFIS